MTQHQYTGALLGKIWLENGYTRHDTQWGSGTSYEDVDGLFAAITHHLCLSPHRLVGEDVRYLRRRLNLTQDELGTELGVTGQAIAKWEKDQVATIPAAAARLLRLLALAQIAPNAPLAQALVEYDEPAAEKLTFSYDEAGGWFCTNHEHAAVATTFTKGPALDISEMLQASFGHAGRFDLQGLSAFAHNDQHFEAYEAKFAAA